MKTRVLAMLGWLALMFSAISCHPERDACYAQAQSAAARDAAHMCPGKWSDCAARPGILKQLSDTQAACP